MTFPSVRATATQTFNSANTNHNVTLPAGIVAGDLILIQFVFYPSGTSSAPSGWTMIDSLTYSTTHVIYAKVADGSEGGTTVNIVTSSSSKAACITRVIKDWFGVITGGISKADAVGSSATPDPPSLSPAWGAADTLWLALTSSYQKVTVSAYPTNYISGYNVVTSGGSASTNCGAGSAICQLNAATENPGTYTLSNSTDWIAITIAVRPAAAGNQYSQTLLEFSTIGDTLARLPKKSISNLMTITHSLTKSSTRSISNLATASDTVYKQTSKSFSDRAIISHTLNAVKTILKELLEAITITHSIAKKALKSISQAITATHSLTKITSKSFTQMTTIMHTFSRLPQKYITQAITITHTLTKKVSKSISEFATIVHSIAKKTLKTISDLLLISDLLSAVKQAGGYAKSLFENLTISHTFAKKALKSINEFINIVHSFLFYSTTTIESMILEPKKVAKHLWHRIRAYRK